MAAKTKPTEPRWYSQIQALLSKSGLRVYYHPEGYALISTEAGMIVYFDDDKTLRRNGQVVRVNDPAKIPTACRRLLGEGGRKRAA